MIEEQKETLELISIIMNDIYKNMSPKEIENFFNKTILDMIDKKDLAMQESTIEDEPEPVVVEKKIHDVFGDINFDDLQWIPNENQKRDNHNWHQHQKIHIDQALDYTERIMGITMDGPTYTIADPYGKDIAIRNLALEQRKKIKNPNPNFEHLLNKKKKRKNKGIK